MYIYRRLDTDICMCVCVYICTLVGGSIRGAPRASTKYNPQPHQPYTTLNHTNQTHPAITPRRLLTPLERPLAAQQVLLTLLPYDADNNGYCTEMFAGKNADPTEAGLPAGAQLTYVGTQSQDKKGSHDGVCVCVCLSVYYVCVCIIYIDIYIDI